MASKSDPKTYTKPELRDKIKQQVVKGDKGGNSGQWSARKAQLLAQEYEKEGGGYRQPRNAAQKSLQKWGDEEWRTADGSKAREGGKTKRYLPKKAWDKLSSAEKRETERKKVEGSKKGQQFVANTAAAADARKKAVGRGQVPKKAAKKAVTKSATKRTTSKKRATQNTAPQKSTAQKSTAKKGTGKKSTGKKSTAKRATKR